MLRIKFTLFLILISVLNLNSISYSQSNNQIPSVQYYDLRNANELYVNLNKKPLSVESKTKIDFTKQPINYNIPQQNTNSYCDTKCKISIAVYGLGAGTDVYSSLGKREANFLWRDKNGIFNPTTNSLYKAGILASTFWKQETQPNRMFWVRTLGGILFLAVGTRNFIVTKNVKPLF